MDLNTYASDERSTSIGKNKKLNIKMLLKMQKELEKNPLTDTERYIIYLVHKTMLERPNYEVNREQTIFISKETEIKYISDDNNQLVITLFNGNDRYLKMISNVIPTINTEYNQVEIATLALSYYSDLINNKINADHFKIHNYKKTTKTLADEIRHYVGSDTIALRNSLTKEKQR